MTYNFKCKECGFIFQESLMVKDYSEKMDLKQIECPECKSNNVVREYSPVGVHYKQMGYYTNEQPLDDPAVADVMDTCRSKKKRKK